MPATRPRLRPRWIRQRRSPCLRTSGWSWRGCAERSAERGRRSQPRIGCGRSSNPKCTMSAVASKNGTFWISRPLERAGCSRSSSHDRSPLPSQLRSDRREHLGKPRSEYPCGPAAEDPTAPRSECSVARRSPKARTAASAAAATAGSGCQRSPPENRANCGSSSGAVASGPPPQAVTRSALAKRRAGRSRVIRTISIEG